MPPLTRQQSRSELLSRLLEAHERSKSFGKPGPWPRDVIVRLDAENFPEAFGPEGRETLDAFRAGAEALERDGALRIVRDRGPLAGVPKELRLGPNEVEQAYAYAEPLGFEPLSRVFGRFEKACKDLACSTPAAPDWMIAHLEAAAAAAENFDATPFGASRAVLKKTANERLGALKGAWGVSHGWNGWERVVSERIFRDSKRLGALRSLVIDILVRADPEWAGVAPDETEQVLEAYGVRRKPGLIRCAGAGTLIISGRPVLLSDFVPTAHLPEAWTEAWVDAVAPSLRTVTLVENEFPFLSYVEEAGGAAALGERGELVVYVAGFPTPGLVDALSSLSARAPSSAWRHWGDADVGGVRIWWHLRTRLSRPLEWYRSTLEWLEAESPGGPLLTPKELGALEQLSEKIAASSLRGAPDVLNVQTLIGALRRLGRRVEQERY
jgi:hypothetical protein